MAKNRRHQKAPAAGVPTPKAKRPLPAVKHAFRLGFLALTALVVPLLAIMAGFAEPQLEVSGAMDMRLHDANYLSFSDPIRFILIIEVPIKNYGIRSGRLGSVRVRPFGADSTLQTHVRYFSRESIRWRQTKTVRLEMVQTIFSFGNHQYCVELYDADEREVGWLQVALPVAFGGDGLESMRREREHPGAELCGRHNWLNPTSS